MLGTLWSVVTLPFRLIAAAVEAVGRVTGVVVGFALMVVGVALCSAGQLAILGLPLFLIGLFFMLRSLG